MGYKNGYLFAAVFRVMLIGILGCEIPPTDPDPIDPIDPVDPPASSMPCAARPGAIKPWEGVLCNGNLQLGVSLSVIGIGLSYNSIDAMHQEGFGYGWRLSVRSRLSEDELENITVIRSDGTKVVFDLEGSDYRAEPLTFSRLTVDDQGNFTETFKGGKRHVYRQVAGNYYLYQQIDRNGNIITINRDGLGRETNLTDSYGRTVTFSFNNDMLQAVTDHEGRTFVLGYNQAGELISVTQPAVEAGIPVTRFEYDSDGTHLVVSQITPGGQTTSFEYYDGGVLKAVTGAGGHQMLVEYTPTSVTQKYSMGEQTIQQFVDGELMAVTNELGMFVYYNRDSRHRVTRITDSLLGKNGNTK